MRFLALLYSSIILLKFFHHTPQIPLPLLHSVARTSPNFKGTAHPIILRTRDYIVYDLIFPSAEEADGVWESLKGLCTGVTSTGLEGLYAFYYEGEERVNVEGSTTLKVDRKGKGKAGWNIYEPEKEFSRMGVGSRSNAWRFSNVNKDYEVRHSNSLSSL